MTPDTPPVSDPLSPPPLPQLASGVLPPQSVAVSLRLSRRHRTRIVPGGAVGVDTRAKVCVIRKITGELVDQPYDHLVLAPGSVTRTFDIPGFFTHLQPQFIAEQAAVQLERAAFPGFLAKQLRQ